MQPHILNHFKTNDPLLYSYILNNGIKRKLEPVSSSEYFFKLCREIAFQQLTGKAASTIFGRVLKLVPNENFTPEEVLKLKHEDMRAAGLSNAKANYIRNIAQAVVDDQLEFDKFSEMEDEEIIQSLIKVKGIGRWTAEMFLMFAIGRENIFSFGDLGLIKGLQKIYGFKKKPAKRTIERIIKKWAPYKSYGSFALWESLEGS